MRGPETRLRKKIQTALKKRWPKSLFKKIHGGAFQNIGISDMLGSVHGIFFALEVKLPKSSSKPTEAQLAFIESVIDSGGFGGVVRSPEQAIQTVENGLKKFKERIQSWEKRQEIKKPRR